MGWSGSGSLGVKEQGIQDPIKGEEGCPGQVGLVQGMDMALDDPSNYYRNKSCLKA